jgi:hypothetical protein
VHGARADDDEETVIALLDDLNSFFAALEDCGDGVCWSRNLRGEELGLNERVVAEDCMGAQSWSVSCMLGGGERL